MKIDKSLPKVVLLIISLEENYDHLLEQLSQSTKSGYAERSAEKVKVKIWQNSGFTVCSQVDSEQRNRERGPLKRE